MAYGSPPITAQAGARYLASPTLVCSLLKQLSIAATDILETGSYIPDPSDTTGYNSDKIGIAWVTFDKSSGSSGSATPRIFVGVANKGTNSVYVSTNGGSSCE